MLPVTLTSMYGKTMELRKHGFGENVSITLNDENGQFVQNLLMPKQQIDILREALTQPASGEGEFYVMRQRKDDPLKLKVIFANSSEKKVFTSERLAVEHQERMTRQHGGKFIFFVVAKETV